MPSPGYFRTRNHDSDQGYLENTFPFHPPFDIESIRPDLSTWRIACHRRKAQGPSLRTDLQLSPYENLPGGGKVSRASRGIGNTISRISIRTRRILVDREKVGEYISITYSLETKQFRRIFERKKKARRGNFDRRIISLLPIAWTTPLFSSIRYMYQERQREIKRETWEANLFRKTP